MEILALEVVEAIVGAVEPLYEAPLHGRDRSLRERRLFAHFLPVVGQRFPWIDDIDLLNAQRIHVADYRADVLDVRRVFNDRDEVLADERPNGIGTRAHRWFGLLPSS